jgi:CheY-like chemotaxis protein
MKKCSILIADDNFEDQKIIKDAILACVPDCEINYVYNGNQLMDFVLQKGRYIQNSTLPTGIILDLNMPFLNGFEVLESLQQHAVSIPVYVLSGLDSRRDNNRVLKSGARGHYVKPNRMDDYKGIVSEILSDMQKKK